MRKQMKCSVETFKILVNLYTYLSYSDYLKSRQSNMIISFFFSPSKYKSKVLIEFHDKFAYSFQFVIFDNAV